MTDISASPPPTPTTTPTLSDSLNTVLKAAPELGQSPGLAVGVAQSGGDTQGRSQAIARGTNAISDSNAKNTVAASTGGNALTHALNWFGNSVAHVAQDVARPVEEVVSNGVSDLGKVLNAPLAYVQHEYRYLHDVEARHGYGAAVLEGLGIAAGSAAGFVAGGGYGAVLGGEAATALEGQVLYKDSWQRTTSGSYTDPHTHLPVSLGRDVASFLGLRPGTTTFKIGSGLIDGIADLQVGGTETLGLIKDARSAAGASGLLGNYFGGTAALTAEDVDRAFHQYGSVRRAFADIADKNAGEIIATPAYQGLRQIAPQLGRAQSAEDVAQIFKEVARTQELAFSNQLPTLSFTRIPFQTIREYAENTGGPLGRASRAFTRLPESFDSAAQSLSSAEFDPSDPIDNGALGLYRLLRFAETRGVAASVVDEYLNAPDLGTRIQIFRNATLNTLFSMANMRGITEDEYLNWLDPADRSAMKEALDNFTGGGAVGQAGVYGIDDQGRNLSLVKDQAENGRQYAAAITDNQTGKLKFISLAEMRRAAKTLQGARDLFGRVDDFGYHYVTQGFFKPLVLLTPSYAEHIALAELVPNALRVGVRNLVKSGMAINAAKLGAKAENEELGPISGLAWRLVDGARSKSTKLDQRLELAARYVEYNDGHFQALGLSSGHNYSEEVTKQERSASLLRHSYNDAGIEKTGDTFGMFANGDRNYADSWQSWLHELAGDEKTRVAAQRLRTSLASGKTLDEATRDASAAVATWLHDQGPEYLGRYTRSLDRIDSFPLESERPAGMDALDDWSHVVVQNLRGATRGMHNGPIHDALLEHIANGETPDINVLDGISSAERPLVVKGREIVPDGTSAIQRIANVGFTKVLNPMVNFLSRQPIAFDEFERQYKMLVPNVDAGIMDEDEAMTTAMSRTVNNVIRNVHNLHDRTQWTVTLRNWAPFFFAQEQAYRRFGRLLAQNPRAFRQYQLMIANIHDVGQIFGGQNGQSYFVLPGTGWMTSGVARAASSIGLPVQGSAPVGMGWNLNSTSVIFPLSSGVRPDLGPLAAIPTDAMAQLFPETLSPVLKGDLTSVASGILGPTATEPIYEQMVPNTIVQRLLGAAFPAFNARSFNSTMMQTLQTLDYENKVPPPNAGYREMQSFIDRVQNQTRIMYAMKAIVGAVTPVSPELQVQNFGFPTELTNDIAKAGSVNKGITAFLAKHPDATPYTVFQSANLTGASIPASIQAENWINENYGLINKYPNAGILMMPMNESTKYNPGVYNAQIAQSLRSKLSPGQWTENGQVPSYIDQLYISAGNSIVLSKWYPQYEKQIQGLTGSMKYQAEQNWQQTLANYAVQNPVWGNWWNSNTRAAERTQAIQQMKEMFRNGDAPDSLIARDTKQLLAAYDVFQNQLASGRQDNFAGESQSLINQQWKDNLYATVAAHPEITNVVNGLFLSLPTASKVPARAPGQLGTAGSFSAKNWESAA